MRRLLLLASLLTAVGCHHQATTSPDAAEPEPLADTVVLGPPRTTAPGVPHGASIQELVVAVDGSGALSVDKAGSMRLWPSLDGTREPLPLPGRGARAMSLARAKDGWLVGLVDSAGGAKVLGVDAAGRVTPLFDIDPFAPVRAIEVLPGGERALVIGEDHRVRLFSAAGEERASLEKREFRPIRALVSRDGSVVLLSVKLRAPGRVEGEVQAIEVGASALRTVGAPVAFVSAVEPDEGGFSMSPDGSTFCHLRRDGVKWMLHARRLADGHEESIDLEMNDGQTPAVGFVGPGRVLVTSRERGVAWLVDVESHTRRPRVTAHQPSQPMPIAHQAGMQVVGYGTHLAVQHLDGEDQGQIDYFGYRGFVAQAGAVSPSGTNLAWSVGGEILVEPMDQSREPKRLRPEASFGVQFLAFADEDHIVGIGSDGAARVYHWKTGALVDELSLGMAVQGAHFDVAHGLVLVQRLWGDAAVVVVNEDRTLTGPYLISDGAFRMGLLSGPAPGVWTIDANHKRRDYSLAQLRADQSQQQVSERGETVTVPGGGQVMLLDGGDVSYQIVQDGLRRELHRRKGTESPQKVSLGAHQITHVMLSPDRTLLVAVAQGTGTVLAFDASSLAAKWTFSATQMQGLPSFSPDGRRLVYLSFTGAAVLDAATGEAVLERCGTDFGRRGAPPFDAFSFSEAPSFCE